MYILWWNTTQYDITHNWDELLCTCDIYMHMYVHVCTHGIPTHTTWGLHRAWSKQPSKRFHHKWSIRSPQYIFTHPPVSSHSSQPLRSSMGNQEGRQGGWLDMYIVCGDVISCEVLLHWPPLTQIIIHVGMHAWVHVGNYRSCNYTCTCTCTCTCRCTCTCSFSLETHLDVHVNIASQ